MFPDRGQLVDALVLVVSALFVSVGLVAAQYQTLLRRVCVAAFVVALGIALVWSALWLVRRLF
ncbi:MAG TPA: hypothetical protein VL985_08950 [Stellaceae bacterium]|nr:hypothetical protein [Stellaceae bacterium]